VRGLRVEIVVHGRVRDAVYDLIRAVDTYAIAEAVWWPVNEALALDRVRTAIKDIQDAQEEM
jgi:hypothetical protein